MQGLMNCQERNKKKHENYTGGEMASKTSDAKKYKRKIGKVNLTIIDTPGFGDTRGTEVDNQNFEKIKQTVLK